jgi:hypothetical protein
MARQPKRRRRAKTGKPDRPGDTDRSAPAAGSDAPPPEGQASTPADFSAAAPESWPVPGLRLEQSQGASEPS